MDRFCGIIFISILNHIYIETSTIRPTFPDCSVCEGNRVCIEECTKGKETVLIAERQARVKWVKIKEANEVTRSTKFKIITFSENGVVTKSIPLSPMPSWNTLNTIIPVLSQSYSEMVYSIVKTTRTTEKVEQSQTKNTLKIIQKNSRLVLSYQWILIGVLLTGLVFSIGIGILKVKRKSNRIAFSDTAVIMTTDIC